MCRFQRFSSVRLRRRFGSESVFGISTTSTWCGWGTAWWTARPTREGTGVRSRHSVLGADAEQPSGRGWRRRSSTRTRRSQERWSRGPSSRHRSPPVIAFFSTRGARRRVLLRGARPSGAVAGASRPSPARTAAGSSMPTNNASSVSTRSPGPHCALTGLGTLRPKASRENSTSACTIGAPHAADTRFDPLSFYCTKRQRSDLLAFTDDALREWARVVPRLRWAVRFGNVPSSTMLYDELSPFA
ncbi:hypothetical protein BH11MYX4_BH11MYX4_01950 [soil metagenome]